MVYNNNQQTTSLMYYNDSNYFDQHFDGKNKSIYVCLYLKCCVISRILNFHFLHTALILLLGKDRTESHMATDRSLETDCRNDFFPREKHLAVRFRSTHQNI